MLYNILNSGRGSRVELSVVGQKGEGSHGCFCCFGGDILVVGDVVEQGGECDEREIKGLLRPAVEGLSRVDGGGQMQDAVDVGHVVGGVVGAVVGLYEGPSESNGFFSDRAGDLGYFLTHPECTTERDAVRK